MVGRKRANEVDSVGENANSPGSKLGKEVIDGLIADNMQRGMSAVVVSRADRFCYLADSAMNSRCFSMSVSIIPHTVAATTIPMIAPARYSTKSG